MNRILDYGKYIDTVKSHEDFFKKYYFHSLIDLNLAKLDNILQYGILSKNLIEQNCLISLYTHDSRDSDSKNGNTYISLTEYKENCEFSTLFESFPLHTLTSLSLLINKDIAIKKEGERETFFDDEVFCLDQVSVSSLEGIMLPEHLSHLPISQINCLPNDLSCYTKNFVNHWITCMQKYFNTTLSEKSISEIKTAHKELWDILKQYENPWRWVASAIQDQANKYGRDFKDVLAGILEDLWSKKFDIPTPTFIDVLIKINNDKLPIYEIQQKSLKKIINAKENNL